MFNQNNDQFYAKGLKFSCKMCSRCCCVEPGFVYLSENDLKNLVDFFKISREQFIKDYCRWIDLYNGTEALSLKETINNGSYDCILWDNGCKAYQNKPLQCTTYPFWTKILSSRENWEQEKRYCPGIGSGELHSSLEINVQKSMYEGNVPVIRKIEKKVNS